MSTTELAKFKNPAAGAALTLTVGSLTQKYMFLRPGTYKKGEYSIAIVSTIQTNCVVILNGDNAPENSQGLATSIADSIKSAG